MGVLALEIGAPVEALFAPLVGRFVLDVAAELARLRVPLEDLLLQLRPLVTQATPVGCASTVGRFPHEFLPVLEG